MKAKHVIFLILLLGYYSAQAQHQLVKDFDHDGIQDSVFYNQQVIVKLSTQNFKPIYSPKNISDNLKVRLSDTHSGFELTIDDMRAGNAYQFRYAPKYKRIRLIGISHYEFGPATNDGSGEASVNLLTHDFIANWHHYDHKKSELIELPTYKDKLQLPTIFLSDLHKGDAVGDFFDKCYSSFELQKKKYEQKQATAKKGFDKVWKGKLGDKIPVRVQYHVYDSIAYGNYGKLVVGRITYRNTSSQTPIPLIGYVTNDCYFELREFQKDGTISGIINGTEKGESFEGNWGKPYSKTNYTIHLTRKDTIVPSADIRANADAIYGNYAYQFGDKGYLGELKLTPIDAKQAKLYMFSVTSAPSRNMADLIDNDTIPAAQTTFVHQVSGTQKCAVKLRFFKHFVMVNYPENSPCQYAFGARATYEGFYYKVNYEIQTND